MSDSFQSRIAESVEETLIEPDEAEVRDLAQAIQDTIEGTLAAIREGRKSRRSPDRG